MTRNEYLLTVVSEECAEIQQAVSKILRFGVDGRNPYDPATPNGDHLLTEYYQLEEMMEMLFDADILIPFNFPDILHIREDKREKVEKYMDVSKRLGYLQEK